VRERSWSCREAAFTIAASEELQRFIFAGDFTYAKCPGKTKINDFNSIVPEPFLHKLNDLLLKEFTAVERVAKYGLDTALDNKTLWLDATCLKANIHFPVDWVLLRDAVRTIVKTILCIRRHGLKHRITTPESFLSKINSLSMEMANSRRRKDAAKRRKNTLRRMKKIAHIVQSHGQRYRDLLASNWEETDLSEKQTAQIIERIENILKQLPAAIEQAHRRIISEKQLSAEVEFGNELFIAEQADGFIVDWHLYEEKVADQRKFRDFLERMHPQEMKHHALVGDRGFDGGPNCRLLEKYEIINHLCPKSPEEYEKRLEDVSFRPNQKRRSQTEGRIAAVKRFVGPHLKNREFEAKRCHAGWAVITHNLHLLAKLMKQAEAQTLPLAG
jgi:hypothetical protein